MSDISDVAVDGGGGGAEDVNGHEWTSLTGLRGMMADREQRDQSYMAAFMTKAVIEAALLNKAAEDVDRITKAAATATSPYHVTDDWFNSAECVNAGDCSKRQRTEQSSFTSILEEPDDDHSLVGGDDNNSSIVDDDAHSNNALPVAATSDADDSTIKSSKKRKKNNLAVATVDKRQKTQGTVELLHESPTVDNNVVTNAANTNANGEEMTSIWSNVANLQTDNIDMYRMDEMFLKDKKIHAVANGSEGFETRSVYALLARLDQEKCADLFDGTGSDNMRKIVDSVLWCVWRLGRFAKRRKIDTFNVSVGTIIALTSRFAEVQTTALDRNRPLDDLMVDESGTNEADVILATRCKQLLDDDSLITPEDVTQRAKMLLGDLDHETKGLLLRLGQARGCKFVRDMRDERFATLNFVDDSDDLSYDEYAMTRLRFVRFQNNAAYVNGFYLVSLMQQMRRGLKFATYDDRFDYMRQIVTKYVRAKIFNNRPLPANVRIFVNLTTTQTCSDFNVLKQLPVETLKAIRREDEAMIEDYPTASTSKKLVGRADVSGVLGLVQFGNVKYDQKKEYISVRGYLTATFSSTTANE